MATLNICTNSRLIIDSACYGKTLLGLLAPLPENAKPVRSASCGFLF